MHLCSMLWYKNEKIWKMISYNVYCFHRRRPQPKSPTLTSSLIILCLIPQSTATTLIGLPFPNTWISLKQEDTWWTLTENAVTAIWSSMQVTLVETSATRFRWFGSVISTCWPSNSILPKTVPLLEERKGTFRMYLGQTVHTSKVCKFWPCL